MLCSIQSVGTDDTRPSVSDPQRTEVWEVGEPPLGVLLTLSQKDLLTDHQVLGIPLPNLATLDLNRSLQLQTEAEAHRPHQEINETCWISWKLSVELSVGSGPAHKATCCRSCFSAIMTFGKSLRPLPD